MAEPFNRKAIAKDFSSLVNSDSEPRARTGSQGANKSGKPEASVKAKQNCLLLDLPLEIRVEIYDLLLVSRFNRLENPSRSVGNTYQQLIMLDELQSRRSKTMEPALLQTCKQVYEEAAPILYSRNVFRFHEPHFMVQFMAQIGHTNMRLIRALDIYVPPDADKLAWLNLLHILPEATPGLKSVVVAWWGVGDWGGWPQSLGTDVDFARALAALSKLGLEQLKIKGHYAKPWPAYFREMFGAQVVEAQEGRLPSYDDDDEYERLLNEEYLEDFKQYQAGTELLNPWEEEVDDAAVP